MITLSSDKGSYSGTETPIFTVTYSSDYIGKEIILNLQEATGSFTMIDKKLGDATGVAVFNYRPSNQGNYTFVAQATPCFIIFNCETSNKIVISITGNLPCNPLDPLCNAKPIWGELKWVAYAIILVMAFLFIRDLGLLRSK